jgi:hypothetical protein
VATVDIKGTTSSSKSLFPKLNKEKYTYLMAKESKRKVPKAHLLLDMLLMMMMIIMMMMLVMMMFFFPLA